MLARSDWLKTDEWDLHGEEEAEDEEGGVGGVDARRVATHQQESEDVKRNQVDDKHITTPR